MKTMLLTSVALVVASVPVAFLAAADQQGPLASLRAAYLSWWKRKTSAIHAYRGLRWVPLMQALTVSVAVGLWIHLEQPALALIGLVAAAGPPWLVVRRHKGLIQKLKRDLDSFLTALSDSLSAVPNLTEALAAIVQELEPPVREEVAIVLGEVRLGRSIDDALINMATRVKLPGLDAAVGAALLGRRSGGDLPRTLRQMAETMREMDRLEGMIRAKTAEGRSQAWVMGLVPPGMILLLEKVDPNWLYPVWNDPLGWILLGSAAVLEVIAVALVRRILAVDI